MLCQQLSAQASASTCQAQDWMVAAALVLGAAVALLLLLLEVRLGGLGECWRAILWSTGRGVWFHRLCHLLFCTCFMQNW
jgi:hypothetical protein